MLLRLSNCWTLRVSDDWTKFLFPVSILYNRNKHKVFIHVIRVLFWAAFCCAIFRYSRVLR
jgi:hypothetical protein